MSNLSDKLKELPDSPGVYFFKGGGEILYIGKATSIRDRVRSYIGSDLLQTRGPLIQKMVEEADDVVFEETDSVLEALILEANLIKKHQPDYNTRDKDNKSFSYVVVTNEEYPRVFRVRERELQISIDPEEIKYSFGPYTQGGQLNEALRLVRKIFPFRGEKDPVQPKRQQSRLNMQIGLSPDFRRVDRREYLNTIQNIRLFFEGKKKKLLKKLEREMKKCVKEDEFEEAERIKRQMFALQHIQDVSLIRSEEVVKGRVQYRIEAYDIAHISGTNMVGVMTVVEDGFAKKQDYRMFKIKSVTSSNDTAALREVLERRLTHPEWQYPNLIVVDGGTAQLNVATEVLKREGYSIPVVSVVKSARHQPERIMGDEEMVSPYEKEILIANSEAHRFAQNYHKKLRRKL